MDNITKAVGGVSVTAHDCELELKNLAISNSVQWGRFKAIKMDTDDVVVFEFDAELDCWNRWPCSGTCENTAIAIGEAI